MITKARTLVIHGAGEGAHREDAVLADFVRRQAQDPSDVAYPRLEGIERYSAGWAVIRGELETALANISDGGQVVAHSAGGAALLKFLSEGGPRPRLSGLFLIAMPYIGREDGWASDDFYLDDGFAERLADCGDIRLYHSRDDDIVPVHHIDLYAAKLPQAAVRILDGYGHQFSSRPFRELADDLAIQTGARR